MKRKELLKKITQAAGRDRKRREDPRFIETLGFLVAKGFLLTNQNVPLLPNKKIKLRDAIWAGTNVEPRILEVLPAAALRLPRHFDLNANEHPELFAIVEKLKGGETTGDPLWGVPYEKLMTWVHFPLTDRRMKDIAERKVTKTFRLKPTIVRKLRELALNYGCSETEALERSIARVSP